MDEAERSSTGCSEGSSNNETQYASESWSAGFVVPMSALIVLDLLVVVGNSLVVTAVFTHAKLRRSTTNRFIVSLAAADLMVGLLVLPFSSANEVSSLHTRVAIWGENQTGSRNMAEIESRGSINTRR